MKVKSLSDKDNPVEQKIMTKKRFSAAVEHLVANNNMSYIDAASYVVEQRGMDYKNLKKLLTTKTYFRNTIKTFFKNINFFC